MLMLGDEVQTIYCEYSDDVYRYILSLCRDPAAAEDILQSTFLQIVKSASTFRGECTIKTWLFAIARHEYFRWQKKNPPSETIYETYPAEENVEAECERRDVTQRILDLVGDADEPHRSLMLLRLASGLQFKEIGAIIGKSETWARVNFMRGKIKLMKILEEE